MKALELFSGIGGMHFALKESGIDCQVSCALDINTTANAVYRHNFRETRLLENNVQCLDDEVIRKMGVKLITMSPPCQPFTRVGLQKDDKDNRSSALHHVLNLLPKLTGVDYLIVENVVGFETSKTRDQFISVLRESGFRYQEFILSPHQFFIPNSRTRYYLLAKRLAFIFQEVNQIFYKLPEITDDEMNSNVIKFVNKYRRQDLNTTCIDSILGETGELLSDKTLQKYGQILDIVTKDSGRSCCFTKGYSHYTEGTGSVFCPFSRQDIQTVFEKISKLDKDSFEYLNELKRLKMRYFSPSEIAHLMAFPAEFSFPENLTNKQKYRVLGNSLNVHVVAVLIKLLVL